MATSQGGVLRGSPELTKKVKTSITAMQADKGKHFIQYFYQYKLHSSGLVGFSF